MAVRQALHRGAKTWAKKTLDKKAGRMKKDAVITALLARATAGENDAWQKALTVLSQKNGLAVSDTVALLSLAPQSLSGNDIQFLKKLAHGTPSKRLQTEIHKKLKGHDGHGHEGHH